VVQVVELEVAVVLPLVKELLEPPIKETRAATVKLFLDVLSVQVVEVVVRELLEVMHRAVQLEMVALVSKPR
jgi:hypothetical protein